MKAAPLTVAVHKQLHAAAEVTVRGHQDPLRAAAAAVADDHSIF